MPSAELLEYLGGLVIDDKGHWTGPEDLEAGGLEALVLPVIDDRERNSGRVPRNGGGRDEGDRREVNDEQ